MFVDFICTVPFLADKGCPQNEYEQNEYVCCWLCYNFFCVFRFINKTTRYFLFKRNHRKAFLSKVKGFPVVSYFIFVGYNSSRLFFIL